MITAMRHRATSRSPSELPPLLPQKEWRLNFMARPNLENARPRKAVHIEVFDYLAICDNSEPPLLIRRFMHHSVNRITQRPIALLPNITYYSVIVV